jgi:hypothetical protein
MNTENKFTKKGNNIFFQTYVPSFGGMDILLSNNLNKLFNYGKEDV